ncbi:aminotransferase-like domain-containing protein [Streptomyces vinaceus]|uniref:hypothetical protein n=1 Tax=Streptomyces vinaceus TaxID=1960 RepID=UPI00369104E3
MAAAATGATPIGSRARPAPTAAIVVVAGVARAPAPVAQVLRESRVRRIAGEAPGHRRRRDAMLRAISAHLPGARVHGAAAGPHLRVTFAGAAFADTALAARALAPALGVKAHPMSWHHVRPGPPRLVLGHAGGPPGEPEEGVALLGRALSRHR